MRGNKLLDFSRNPKLSWLLWALALASLLLLFLCSSPVPIATPKETISPVTQQQLIALINDQATLISDQQKQLATDNLLLIDATAWRKDALSCLGNLDKQIKDLTTEHTLTDLGLGVACAAIIAEALVIAFKK